VNPVYVLGESTGPGQALWIRRGHGSSQYLHLGVRDADTSEAAIVLNAQDISDVIAALHDQLYDITHRRRA
jgi:hypothetical protein